VSVRAVADDSFKDFVLDQLGGLPGLRARRMFGGTGLYAGDVLDDRRELPAQADWVIDLGPEGGDRSGRIVVEGTSELVAQNRARTQDSSCVACWEAPVGQVEPVALRPVAG